MNKRLVAVIALIVIALAATATILTSYIGQEEEKEPPRKILFVGTILTYHKKGLDYHLGQLASSADPALVIEVDSVTEYARWVSLEKIWEETDAREVIDKGGYDVVVLQGTPEIILKDVDAFHEVVRKFDAEIKEVGGETVLLMAWPEVGRWNTLGEIDQAHCDIAEELGIDVAPVCLAWQRAMEERPDLELYEYDAPGVRDRIEYHPNIHGTYLAVNVVYATVFGESPVGLAYVPPKLPLDDVIMTEEEADFLQRIAWETVQEFQEQ